MSHQNLLIDDKSKFIKVLEMFPEELIDELVNSLLFNGKYPVETDKLLNDYNRYTRKILSEFNNRDINKAWKKFNMTFYILHDFLITEFFVTEYHRKTEIQPEYKYLKPAWHHNFHEDPFFDEKKLIQWDNLLEKLRELSGNFEDAYEGFIRTAKNVLSDNPINSEVKKKSKKTYDKEKNQHSKSSQFTLKIDFNDLTREIRINNILISRLNFNSANHSLFEYLFKNIGKTFERKELEDSLKIKIKPFNNFLNDIKIKKDIRKYLVNYSKNNIRLNNFVKVDDYDDINNIESELNKLKKVEIN